jgi:hypothetical protein
LDDAWEEIADEQEDLKRAIVVEAINLAHDNGHPYVDKTYIKKASQRIRMWGRNQSLIWALRIILLTLGVLAPIQISALLTNEVLTEPFGLQVTLWLFPIFSITLIIVLSFALKDSIF